MAMMTCGECGGDLSSQARSCPHCGYRYPRSTLELIGAAILAGVLLAVVAVVTTQVLDLIAS